MTTLQEKENEIRKKTRQLREEIRIYMKIYKELELKVDRISLDEGPKEKMKGQQKDAESPSFPFSIESQVRTDIDQWAEREKLTPETVRVLKEEGFDSLEKLSDLTSADIDTLFINTNVLKKQQCLRLKRAVERLNTESSQGQEDSGHVAGSAGQQRWFWQSEDKVLEAWAESSDVMPQTLRFLKEEGFSSMKMISRLTPEKIDKAFQGPRLLPLGQCLALKEAVKNLAGETAAPAPGPKTWGPQSDYRKNFHTASPWDSKSFGDTTEACQNPYYFNPSSSQTMRFLLMGKTGGGKSTTGNTILGEPLFDADIRFSSVTSSSFFRARMRHGITIEITDSPGLCDTKTSEEDNAIKVAQAVAVMNPGPTAFLYVIGIGRYTEEDDGVYKRIKSLFDDRVTGYTIIIFTRGDHLKRQNKTIKDVLSTAPDSLRQALRECNNRYVVFDNMADDKQPQVKTLIQLVRKMSEENGWKPYTCPRYEQVGERVNKEVARRLKKVEEEELKRKKYVQELEEKTKLAEEKAEQERIAFERKEAERVKRMKKAEEEREEKMVALQKMINEQKLSAEKQKEEERKLQQEQAEMMKKLEKERNDELKRIEKQMEEAKQLLKDKAAALEAQREAHRELMEARERVEQKVKTEVAEQSAPSCIIL